MQFGLPFVGNCRVILNWNERVIHASQLGQLRGILRRSVYDSGFFFLFLGPPFPPPPLPALFSLMDEVIFLISLCATAADCWISSGSFFFFETLWSYHVSYHSIDLMSAANTSFSIFDYFYLNFYSFIYCWIGEQTGHCRCFSWLDFQLWLSVNCL